LKKKSASLKFLLIGFLSLIIVYSSLSLFPAKLFFSIQDLSSWYVYHFSRESAKPIKIVGIEIDDYSLNKIPQRWPWKRSIYAQLLHILNKERAYTIGIDLVFSGESEDKEDDRLLKEALSSISCRVVLAYYCDKQGVPLLPKSEFRESAYSLGMVNAPGDADNRIRRQRAFVKVGDQEPYYSFSVQLAAAALNKSPQQLLEKLPLREDKTFFITYLIKPKDIVRVSVYDVLENLESLKKRYGGDFLKESMVVIYQSADVLHDIQATPLGEMPGGILQINGVLNILLNRLLQQKDPLIIPFFIFTFLIILYILSHLALISGFIFTLGVLFLNFWFAVLLNLRGLKVDYYLVAIFGITFFTLGSLYKYTYFLSQLLHIKSMATIDPLRNLFTSRYFYYRMELEKEKIYFGKSLFLVFINFQDLAAIIQNYPLERVKELWQKINPLLSLKDSFWSVYSQEELVGCLASRPEKIRPLIRGLKNNLEAYFKENTINSKVKLGCLKFKKEYAIREILFILSKQTKDRAEDLTFLQEEELKDLFSPLSLKIEEKHELLESLDEDIAEKNRQLLSFVEDLRKEHGKTKEAFFQIITSLANALEARDPYTEGHSERVTNYAIRLAKKLNWNEEAIEKLKKASLLHDLGKIGIPDSILHKKGKLNDEEYDFIKKHQLITVKILEPLKEWSEILPWIMYHHERWDGKGYPHGLGGDAIPMASQIIAICDVFDALTSGRDYKSALSVEEAIQELIKNKGTQFNSKLIDLFREVILEDKQEK